MVREGFGITPFIGSGCSSASGILMGQEFTDYLGYVVYRCVSRQLEEGAESDRRWDISRQGWPDRPNPDEVNVARKWALKVFKRICGDGIHITQDPEHRVQSYQAMGATTPALLAKMLASPMVPLFLRSPNLFDDGETILSIRESLDERPRDHRFYIHSSNSPTSYAAICEKALRSMCDWRATLQFLSSLRSSRDPELLSMEEPSQSVIDSFNVHITRDKRPNLTHMMIAQLSMSARIRVALTTNFDPLLETAFSSFGRHLSVIPVGLNDLLPHPDLVHQNDCVVKLHGDCHETRADFSLDGEPAPEDKRRFFHYVRGRFPAFDQPAGSAEEAFLPSQLLVIGYSGSDTRCNDMLKYVLDSDKGATIYWICHSQHDLKRLNRRFREEDYGGGRIVATVTERPDLLLYDFYQKLNLTLPSAGLTYQFPDRVLPAKDPERKHKRGSTSSEGTAIADQLGKEGQDRDKRKRGSLVIATGSSGVLTVIHEAFNLLGTRGKQRIWLELEDFPTIPVVGAEIYTSLAERTGALPLSYMKPLPRDIWKRKGFEPTEDPKKVQEAWTKFFKEACEELGLSPHSWVIGFYGRNGPGGCSGWEENQYWGKNHYKEFHNLIHGLTLAGFSVLYAPYNRQRKLRDGDREESVMKVLASAQTEAPPIPEFSYGIPEDEDYQEIGNCDANGVPQNGDFYHLHECSTSPDDSKRFETILQSVWRDLLEPSLCQPPPRTELSPKDWRRQVTALYAATLYRQSRHFSAFLNDAVFRCPRRFNLHNFDNDANRVIKVEEWLKVLSKDGFFFTKPGGFAWAYRDTRLAFRFIISHLHRHERNPNEGDVVLRDVIGFRARANFHIGEWYAKAHRVTRHPMPLMEALHHFYQAAIFCDRAEEGDAGDGDFRIYRQRLFFQALTAIHHTLRTGVESLRYWSSNPAIEYLCDNFPDGKKSRHPQGRLSATLDKLMGKTDESSGWSSKTLSKNQKSIWERGNELIERIRREISAIRSKLQDRDPIVHLDNLFVRDEGRDGQDTPEPLLDSLDANWMGKPFGLVSDIIRKAILRMMEPTEDMGENLWRDVGELETKYFSKNPEALHDPRLIHKKVQHLVEWSFIFVRRAKRQARAGDPEKCEASAKQCFLISSILASVAIDFCRLLPVELEAFTTQEQTKALALYALAQGHLGRFDEAHRRLSDARAVIRAMRTEDRHIPLGITELRRAEVLCLQACECGAILNAARYHARSVDGGDEYWTLDYAGFRHSISEDLIERLSKRLKNVPPVPKGMREVELEKILVRHGLKVTKQGNELILSVSGGTTVSQTLSMISKIQQARIGDAWRCVEEARREFVGRTHSERWWGRLYALELRVFGEAGAAMKRCHRPEKTGFEAEHFRMLLFRSRRDIAHYLRKVWKKSLGVAGDGPEDVYERCRATLLYRFALSIQESKAVHSISAKDLERAKKEIDGFVKEVKKAKVEPEAELQILFITKFRQHMKSWGKEDPAVP